MCEHGAGLSEACAGLSEEACAGPYEDGTGLSEAFASLCEVRDGLSEDGGSVGASVVGAVVGCGLCAVGVGVGVGVGSAVDDTSEGVGGGGEGVLAGTGVGEPVWGGTTQIVTPVLVGYGCVGEAGLAETLVVGAVPDAAASMLAGLGGALFAAGDVLGLHPAVDVACGAAVCDFPVTLEVLFPPA